MAHAMMTNFVPEHWIAALQALGKHDWLKRIPNPVLPKVSRAEINPPLDPDLDQHHPIINEMLAQTGGIPRMLFSLMVMSKAVAHGPKMICPPDDLCEALANVTFDIPFEDYRQPFPVIIVEVPDGFRAKMTTQFGIECCKYVMHYHDPVTHEIVGHTLRNNQVSEILFCYSEPDTPFIEDCLAFKENESVELKQADVLHRIALGLGLLLTNFGAKDLGPANPDEHRRNLRNARRNNKGKADRGRVGIAAEIHLIGFEQEVQYCGRREGRPDGDAQGTSRSPHWRRGHFRRQAYGPGWNQHRVIFIKPILIHVGAFKGSLANTSYRITLPEGTRGPEVLRPS